MRIAVGSDHAGFEYKQLILERLKAAGHETTDLGTHSADPVDYPDFIVPVARGVAAGKYDRGIVLGGSGNGEAIAANKVRGVRCALCWNETTAELSRRHNDANVLSLGERMLTPEQTLAIVDRWIETPFDGGRHAARIRKLDSIEP
jgi:ribose 5-phosphate isomerase B